MLYLPYWHYASSWPTTETHRSAADITDLGTRYVVANGVEKEQLSLELLRCFHPYLSKYLDMILRGHLPIYGNKVNEDAKQLLVYLLPRGSDVSRSALMSACRHLHLAFKRYEPGEVYNVLATCLLMAVAKFDPFYVDKVKEVVRTICIWFPSTFTAVQVGAHIDFESKYILRKLTKLGHLTSTRLAPKKVVYQRSETHWPPPESLFSQGPIGLPYYASQQFRYYLKEYIIDQMGQVESKEEVLQLEHRRVSPETSNKNGWGSEDEAEELPYYQADSEHTDSRGRPWAADQHALARNTDLPKMSLEWVESTKDPLFRALSQEDRYLLYMVYDRDFRWGEVATTLGVSRKEAREWHARLLARLREQAAGSLSESLPAAA